MKILISILLIFIAFIIFIRWIEMTSVFYPVTTVAQTPSDIGLTYENVYFKTKDHFLLHGWFVKGKLLSTVLFFHGNSGNIGDRLEKIKMFHELGLNVFIIDYRGYGKSQGKPTEEGVYRDALAAYDYLSSREDISKTKIVIYGESLGGAVAVDLASKVKSSGLIVDSAFSNAVDMAKQLYPFIPSFLVGIKLDSLSKITSIQTPMLFIHSREDEIVPFDLGKKLYNAARDPKEFLEVKGGHNDAYMVDIEQFRRGIQEFLKKYKLI